MSNAISCPSPIMDHLILEPQRQSPPEMGTQANVNSERKGGGVGNRSGRVFTKFPKLPPELREKIWKEHCGDYEPRVVDLWLKESSTEDNLIYCTHSRAPAILHTSSEARHIGLQHYDLFQHDEDDDDDDENEGIQEVEAAADEDDDENEGIQEVEAAADEDDDENESIEGVEAAADEDDDESEGIQEVEAAADKDDDENEGIQEVEAAARPRIYVCWDKDIILPVPFDYDAGHSNKDDNMELEDAMMMNLTKFKNRQKIKRLAIPDCSTNFTIFFSSAKNISEILVYVPIDGSTYERFDRVEEFYADGIRFNIELTEFRGGEGMTADKEQEMIEELNVAVDNVEINMEFEEDVLWDDHSVQPIIRKMVLKLRELRQ